MTTHAVPVKPDSMTIERFTEQLTDTQFAIYVGARIKSLMEKLKKYKDVDWPANILPPTERGDAQDHNDIDHVPTELDLEFVDDIGASACAFAGIVSDDETADESDRTVAPRVQKPQRPKRVSVPTTRYVDKDNGECDGEEAVDGNYDDVKDIYQKCEVFRRANWDRYDMCMQTKAYIQKNPNADDSAMRKDWIETKQEKFIKAYALLDKFLTIVTNWMGNFEEAKAEIQRKLTFKTVKTVKLSLRLGEGDEINVSTPYGPLLPVPVTVFEEQDDRMLCYLPANWGDAPPQVLTVLKHWDSDYTFYHPETGLLNNQWLIALPKTEGWIYTQVQAEACEPDINDYDANEEEDMTSSSSGGISSCESGDDPDFESEDEEWDRKPRKKSNVPKRKVDDTSAAEAAAIQKFLAIYRAENPRPAQGGAAAGGAAQSKPNLKRKREPAQGDAAAGGAAQSKPKLAQGGAAGGGAAQSKPKPKPARGGAAQSKPKPVSAAVTAMRKKLQAGQRAHALAGASAGAGSAARPAARPDSDDDEPLAMRLNKKPKVLSSSESGSDSGSD